MARKAAAKRTRPSVSQMVKNLESDGLKVQLMGRVRNGKLQIDHASIKELERRFPKADMTFVAVNAPFDPVSQTPS